MSQDFLKKYERLRKTERTYNIRNCMYLPYYFLIELVFIYLFVTR